MIIDVTGIELTPGNNGRDCKGNGEHYDRDGKRIQCCCDECNYMLCCVEPFDDKNCTKCECYDCPNNKVPVEDIIERQKYPF